MRPIREVSLKETEGLTNYVDIVGRRPVLKSVSCGKCIGSKFF